MTKVLRSATKKVQNCEDLSSKLSISKNSKNIKRSNKKVLEIDSKENQQNKIWNIKSILSKIFAYTDHRDLIKFNTVCKKWNNVTNPIIHKNIKLNRGWDVMKQIYGKRLNSAANIEEISECISLNAKHAPFIKEFKYNYRLKPQTAIRIFETFRFICSLTIEYCKMSQDQFLGMISPLAQLQELILNGLEINKIIYKRFNKGFVQLPPTLKKLRLERIILVDNPELFIQTINSHNNLVEFFIIAQSSQNFLKPFYKPYPSFLKFKFLNNELQIPHSLFTIFKNNPQLISLKLFLSSWNDELISHISSYLINLEELNITDVEYRFGDYADFIAKFSQPTKIRKLNLQWCKLTNCSLNSILLICPHLEELVLSPFKHSEGPNSTKIPNFSNSTILKKLTIYCDNLSKEAFDSILLNCPLISELNINLSREFKETIKSICEYCSNLERFNIFLPYAIHEQELVEITREFYDTKLFTSKPKCKSTLTHLTLKGLKVIDSKAEYFKNFESLNSIKYLDQLESGYNEINQEIDMDLWPDYRLLISNMNSGYDAELKRNLIN